MTETHYTLPGCPVPIALLTDAHDADPAPVLASVQARAPALIAVAGDLIHGRKPTLGARMAESRNALALLTACARLAPTFVSLGNHEAYLSRDDLDVIRATGAALLDNSWTALDLGGARLVVGGLTSGYYTAYQRTGATEETVHSPPPETGWLDGFAAEPGYHVLLMHHPEYIRFLPPAVELALSGHAHGGQWRFYDLLQRQWRGVYAPDQGLFPRLTGGVVDGRLVISRGIGNPAGIPRLFNGPEVVYIAGPRT